MRTEKGCNPRRILAVLVLVDVLDGFEGLAMTVESFRYATATLPVHAMLLTRIRGQGRSHYVGWEEVLQKQELRTINNPVNHLQ